MGPPQSLAGRAPEVADFNRPSLDEDRRTMATMALVASLREELVALCRWFGSQERVASQLDGPRRSTYL